MKKTVSMTINGAPQSHEVEPRLLLVHYIRELAGLTGTHVGCDTSQCGACTVHRQRQAVKSCTLFAVQADGAQIMTIEGLAKDGKLHPIQEGFWEKHGLQCGFCTPGMIMSAHQLLAAEPQPDRGPDPPRPGRQPLPLHRATTTSSRRSSTPPRRWPGKWRTRPWRTASACSARASSGARIPASSPGKGNYTDDLKLPGHDLRGLRAQPARPRARSARSTRARPSASGRGGGLHRQGHGRA